ncbi:ANTAR domain-containing protein [Streptomyces sclerotialus]|uniref:ANTAR domain-containing protein n=1 Tax=Streptomyces sclerotialus TaxID=1957 RepID=UPI0004C7952E
MSHDEFTRFLKSLRQAADDGYGLSAVSAVSAAHLLQLQALTLNLRARSGSLELLWGTLADGGLGSALEDLQYTLGEGPTLDAARTGETITETDLSTQAAGERWPAFTSAAYGTSARAVIAVPLRLGVATAGVLTGYRTTAGLFPLGQRLDLDIFARAALVLLLNTPPQAVAADTDIDTDIDIDIDIDADTDTGPRPSPPLYHAKVHQATGFLSSRLGIPLEDALLRLRAYAFSHNRRLVDVARDVLDERLHFTPDT